MVLGGQQHAADARVQGQPGELLAQRSQPALRVQGRQLLQGPITVGDQLGIRWVEEREILDVPEAQQLHLQDDRRQVGAPYLRLRELGAGLEIVLRIQPDTYTRSYAPATALALARRGAGDALHRQALDLAAVTVAADAREPRIDHVVDPRHRKGSLGHVGGQNDAAGSMGLENPRLVLGPWRAYRGRISVEGGWCLRRVSAVSRISRSPERNTSTSPRPASASSSTARRWPAAWRRPARRRSRPPADGSGPPPDRCARRSR